MMDCWFAGCSQRECRTSSGSSVQKIEIVSNLTVEGPMKEPGDSTKGEIVKRPFSHNCVFVSVNRSDHDKRDACS